MAWANVKERSHLLNKYGAEDGMSSSERLGTNGRFLWKR